MSNFKEVFQFLELYGGSRFTADVKKSNYDKERHSKIKNLKIIAYDEVWKNLFSQISPYLKDRENKQVYKIQTWQRGEKIYDCFWMEIKDKDKLNYSSSISVVVGKEGIEIRIEYGSTGKASENILINHNKYILSLDKWKEIYNLNLDRYYLGYKEGSGMEKVRLNNFMEDEALRIYLKEKVKTDEKFRVVIKKEFDKDYVLDYKNFHLEVSQSINELNFLYEKAL